MDRNEMTTKLPRFPQTLEVSHGSPSEPLSAIPRKPTFRLHHSIAKFSRASANSLDKGVQSQSFIDRGQEKVSVEFIKSVNFEIGRELSVEQNFGRELGVRREQCFEIDRESNIEGEPERALDQTFAVESEESGPKFWTRLSGIEELLDQTFKVSKGNGSGRKVGACYDVSESERILEETFAIDSPKEQHSGRESSAQRSGSSETEHQLDLTFEVENPNSSAGGVPSARKTPNFGFGRKLARKSSEVSQCAVDLVHDFEGRPTPRLPKLRVSQNLSYRKSDSSGAKIQDCDVDMNRNKPRFSDGSMGILSPSEMKEFSMCESAPSEGSVLEDEPPPDLLNFTASANPTPRKSRLTFSPKKPKIDESDDPLNSTFDKEAANQTLPVYSPKVSDLILCTKATVVDSVRARRDSASRSRDPMVGSLIASSIITSVTSIGSNDGYQGDAEGSGTQNTPVRSILPKPHLFVKGKLKESSSELETSGVYSDFDMPSESNPMPESGHSEIRLGGNLLEVVTRPGKCPSPNKSISSRASVASSGSSVVTKISVKQVKPDPKLRSKEEKNAANGVAKARKLLTPHPPRHLVKREVKDTPKPPAPQVRVTQPPRKSIQAPSALPVAARTSGVSRIPAPGVSQIRRGPSPAQADRPGSRVSSLSGAPVECSPNRRPAPYLAPSKKLAATVSKPRSQSSTLGDSAAPGPLRSGPVGARFSKHESTFRHSIAPVQKATPPALVPAPNTQQWKRQVQTCNKGLMAFAVLIGHSQKQVDSLKEELKTLAVQKSSFERLQREKDELLRAISTLNEDLVNGRNEYSRTVAEFQQQKIETERLREYENQTFHRALEEAERETKLRLEEQASHLHEYYRKEINKSCAEVASEEREAYQKELRSVSEELKEQNRRLRKENAGLTNRLQGKDAEILELRNELTYPLEARFQSQLQKYRDEVASLHTVLTMRNEEIKTGRSAAIELERQNEELISLRDKLQKCELCNEDLNERLKIEREEKRRCEQLNEQLYNQIKCDTQKYKRLSMDKEQLEYKLYSYSGVDLTQCNSPVLLRSGANTFNFSAPSPVLTSTPGTSSPRPVLVSSERRSLSPVPQSPGVMRRVIAKSESLSYVLGFDEGEDMELNVSDVRNPKTSV